MKLVMQPNGVPLARMPVIDTVKEVITNELLPRLVREPTNQVILNAFETLALWLDRRAECPESWMTLINPELRDYVNGLADQSGERDSGTDAIEADRPILVGGIGGDDNGGVGEAPTKNE